MLKMGTGPVPARIAVVFAAALVVACSDDGGGGGSGLNFAPSDVPADDEQTDTIEPPTPTPGTNPGPTVDPESIIPGPSDPDPIIPEPTDPDPVISGPTVPPPVDPDPVTPEPLDPNPVAPQTDDPLVSLYGEVTFLLQFENSGDRFRYATVLGEANRVTGDNGEPFLATQDAGVFGEFTCFFVNAGTPYLCIGAFPTADLTLFGFNLENGAGSGTFEECRADELQNEDDFRACVQDFIQSPDGTIEVLVTPAAQATSVADGQYIESENAFQPMMLVNGQATRFQNVETSLTAEQSVRITEVAARLQQWRSLAR